MAVGEAKKSSVESCLSGPKMSVSFLSVLTCFDQQYSASGTFEYSGEGTHWTEPV